MKKKYQKMESKVYEIESRPIICASGEEGTFDPNNPAPGTY